MSQTTFFRLCSDDPEEIEWSLLRETIGSIIDENEQTKKYENPFHDFFYEELDMINSLSIKVTKLCFSLQFISYFMLNAFFVQNVCVEVPRLLNIVHEECFPIKWLNDFSKTINNNDEYNLSLCPVSSFIEKNTTPGVYKLHIHIS